MATTRKNTKPVYHEVTKGPTAAQSRKVAAQLKAEAAEREAAAAARNTARKAAAKKAAPAPAPAPANTAPVIPATPALDAAANPKVAHKAALELDADVTPAVVCRRRGQSYTCIRLSVGPTATHYIAMDSLTVQKLPNRDFHDEWEEFTQYPVRRAAELYLNSPHRQIDPQARAHLESIVRDPATVYNLEPQPKQLKEDDTMATTATAKKPTAKTPAAPAKKAAPATKAATKAVTEAKPTAKATPVPAKAPAKTPAKTPAAKPTPVPAKPAGKVKAAPNGIATVVNGAKPPAKQAAAAAAKPAARSTDDTKYKVADPSVTRRGATAEFQDEAVKLKAFTRQKLIDTMVAKGYDAAAARIKVSDMVYFKIIVAA